jgi:hypothetical protein
MGELTPDAAALLRAGRASFRPDASDRERVLHSLGGALGEGALIDPPHAPGATAAGPLAARLSWGWSKVLLGGGSMLAVGAGVMVAAHLWNRTPAPVTAANPLSSDTPAVAPPAPPASPVEAEGSLDGPRDDRTTTVTHSRTRSGSPRPADLLKEEVRLLARAEQQLNDGTAGDALETLSEHERRFPKGALAEQRMAARVEALCALGRFGDARADMTKLARAYPKSPHLEGARRFCGSDLGGGR